MAKVHAQGLETYHPVIPQFPLWINATNNSSRYWSQEIPYQILIHDWAIIWTVFILGDILMPQVVKKIPNKQTDDCTYNGVINLTKWYAMPLKFLSNHLMLRCSVYSYGIRYSICAWRQKAYLANLSRKTPQNTMKIEEFPHFTWLPEIRFYSCNQPSDLTDPEWRSEG